MTSRFEPAVGDSGTTLSFHASIDYWSAIDANSRKVTINATAADKALGDIVVAGIPAGATIQRAILTLIIRAVENTSGSANEINIGLSQHIQIRKAASTYIDAIPLIDQMISVAATTRDGNVVIGGTIDVKSEVDGNATYNVQWEDADALAADLILHDVQTILRIYFS